MARRKRKNWRFAVGAVVAMSSAACDYPEPRDARERLLALEAEGDALNQAADALEARLLSDQANVAHWAELAERHRSVSEIACRVSESHLLDMQRNARFPMTRPSGEVLAQIHLPHPAD